MSDLTVEIVEGERAHEAAVLEARSAIIAGRREGRDTLARRLLAKVEAAVIEAQALQAYDAETAALVGVAPGPLPLPGVLMLVPQIARLRRELDGPPAEAPAPVPAGKRRMILLSNFNDKEAMQQRPKGDVVDLDEADAAEAVAKGWAEAFV